MKMLKAILTVVGIVVYGLGYYLCLPTLSLSNFDGFVFIIIGVVLLAALVGLWLTDEYETYRYQIPLGALGACLLVLLIGGAARSRIFTANDRYEQLGEVEERSFLEDIVELDTSQIPIVDIELAEKVADKELGEDLALGSQVEIGEFTNKQEVNGKLYYIAPLEHSGFFKWLSNSEGTPGYVMVSATNPNDVELVREVDEKELKLRYINSGYFGDDIKRHIRSEGYRTTGLTEYSFEIDDDGNPYWVVTTYKNELLWRCPEATGVVICDAQTGECEEYSIEETPEWVDIIQPESFVKSQIKNYGKYVHGFWNFSNKDELSMTEHMTTVYNEGECYYYTGMSSVGKDDGTVGFIMVNTRNKEAIMYRMTGATEEAAMRSAEGKVQDKEYTATVPIPLNISGIPAYFCTLKDDEGLIKEYAMLKIEDYSIVATGESIESTKRSFVNAVNNSGASVDFGDEAYGYTVNGNISRITANVEGGDTYYYMILEGDATKLYVASYFISDELPITREGDEVEISYVQEGNGTINVVTFDNLAFSGETSSEQERLDAEQEENNIINDPNTNITNVDPEANQEEWDSLTEEEKAKLLEQIQNEENE